METTTTPLTSSRRLAVAQYHSRVAVVDSLMADMDSGKLSAEHVANMLACSLAEVHHSLAGNPVYDYESQEWLEASIRSNPSPIADPTTDSHR